MIISLHVTPKASRNQLIGWVMDADGRPVLKVKIAAPPEDGKANKALLKFLSRQWSVPSSKLELISGEGSRHKRLKIHDDALSGHLTAHMTVTKA